MLDGLFSIVETLFEVAIRRDHAPGLEPERRSSTASSASGAACVGQFYLDLYARTGKRPGAWMDDVRARWLRPDDGTAADAGGAPGVQLRRRRVDGQPALLTHDDVITLFHEFGHGLHHMLTQVDERGVSGISGVEWDAVELPSQFMENFCWEWDVLQQLTAHVDTGAPLPRALFDKMLAAQELPERPADAAPGRVRAVRHAAAHRAGRGRPRSGHCCDEVRDEVAVLHAAGVQPHSSTAFSHIFAGGYAAGYYSYKWAEVLSAPTPIAAFEETAGDDGLPNAQTGRKYRQAILEVGGSRPRWKLQGLPRPRAAASTRCCATRAWAAPQPGGPDQITSENQKGHDA